MQKRIFGLIAMMAWVVLLGGCIAGYDDGRQKMHKEIRVAEEKTNQEFLKAKIAELKAKKEKKQNPTLQVTTYYPDGKTVSSVITADIAPSIEAATGGNKHDSNYGLDLKRTEAPEGEFAENLKAGTGMVGTALGAPGTLVYATAKGVSAGIKESGGGGVHLAADEMNIDGSFNKSEASNIGSGSATASTTSGKSAAADDEASAVVDPAHWAECTTGAAGKPTVDEVNGCMIGYGYETEVVDGEIYLDGKPFNGV